MKEKKKRERSIHPFTNSLLFPEPRELGPLPTEPDGPDTVVKLLLPKPLDG